MTGFLLRRGCIPRRSTLLTYPDLLNALFHQVCDQIIELFWLNRIGQGWRHEGQTHGLSLLDVAIGDGELVALNVGEGGGLIGGSAFEAGGDGVVGSGDNGQAER